MGNERRPVRQEIRDLKIKPSGLPEGVAKQGEIFRPQPVVMQMAELINQFAPAQEATV